MNELDTLVESARQSFVQADSTRVSSSFMVWEIVDLCKKEQKRD